MNTMREIVDTGNADAAAIAAPGRETLTYGGLREQVDYTINRLNGFGVGRNDVIAIVLPNGPEMASTFVCVGAAATTAPLNPAYRREEFDFYLADKTKENCAYCSYRSRCCCPGDWASFL